MKTKNLISALAMSLVAGSAGFAQNSVYDFSVKDNQGNLVSLEKYRGKVLLIVNTATKCGFTPQYKDLQEIYETFNADGFEILDFPCNQFRQQAPGTDEEIQNFCTLNYNTTFPRFSKIDVNGENASELYVWLKKNSEKNADIKWNFAKFLIDREGKVVERFEPASTKKTIQPKIEELIKK